MKKSVSVMMAIALCAAMVSGCSGSGGQKDTAAENKKIDKLNVYFVPSRDPEEIVTATEPL